MSDDCSSMSSSDDKSIGTSVCELDIALFGGTLGSWDVLDL